jgi:hypothetical protein
MALNYSLMKDFTSTSSPKLARGTDMKPIKWLTTLTAGLLYIMGDIIPEVPLL